jgi:Holliday junction resolvasome RuvABC endonuclease subunit
MILDSPVFLGIKPGARQIGVCVLKGGELAFYRVKTIKRKSDKETVKKLREVLAQISAEYKIEIAAIEKIVFTQQRQFFVKTVHQEIKDFFKEKNIPLFEYNPKLTRKIICGLEKPRKRNTALRLAQRYPELARYSDVPRVWQRRYFAPLFDAVAAAFVCAIEIREAKALSASPPSKN